RLRGLLSECGHVLPLRASEVHRRVPQLLGKLPTRVAACARDLLEHAARLQAKTLEYEHEIKIHVRSKRSRAVRRLDWASDPSPHQPWWRPSATAMTSRTAASSPPGSDSCLANTQPAAGHRSGTSP